MFRRIELIREMSLSELSELVQSMQGSDPSDNDEVGRRYGQPSITACQQAGQKYRVIAVAERIVDVICRDQEQVAVRGRKRRK